MIEHTITPSVNVELLCEGPLAQAHLTSNIVSVLRKVDQLGSLYAATKSLRMGYSNTLYSIRDVEDALGCKLLERTCSKGSVLTNEGRYLADLYEETRRQTLEYAENLIDNDEVAQRIDVSRIGVSSQDL